MATESIATAAEREYAPYIQLVEQLLELIVRPILPEYRFRALEIRKRDGVEAPIKFLNDCDHKFEPTDRKGFSDHFESITTLSDTRKLCST